MANATLFQSTPGRLLPKAAARNEAGGTAYDLSPKQKLAQYAATGCMNHTFYASAEEQLEVVLTLCDQIEPDFIARCAVHSRQRGYMKDLPALLVAVLAAQAIIDPAAAALAEGVFDRVIDDAKMLRNFVQIVRSGVTGRKSLGSLPKRLVRRWFEVRSDEAVFRASVGNAPSLADVIKLTHPKPATKSRAALYGYLIGREFDFDALPQLVKDFEMCKTAEGRKVPDVPFRLLTGLPLAPADRVEIARNGSWTMTRMNLNTFARHGVFDAKGMTKLIADRLRSPELVSKARAFPYQLLAAYTSATAVPREVRDALQDAMELAIKNVPAMAGKVYVFPDVSGSMHSPITGHRKGATTAVRCVDVAGLIAAAVLRKNPTAEVIPFSDHLVDADLNARDTVLTNAAKLAAFPPGGTNCSLPLRALNDRRATGDVVIYVSDNESWIDSKRTAPSWFNAPPTKTLKEWEQFKQRSPNAKLVCIDLQPYGTTQAAERDDVLNVGGFSDAVFALLAEFAAGTLAAEHWVGAIEAVDVKESSMATK